MSTFKDKLKIFKETQIYVRPYQLSIVRGEIVNDRKTPNKKCNIVFLRHKNQIYFKLYLANKYESLTQEGMASVNSDIQKGNSYYMVSLDSVQGDNPIVELIDEEERKTANYVVYDCDYINHSILPKQDDSFEESPAKFYPHKKFKRDSDGFPKN